MHLRTITAAALMLWAGAAMADPVGRYEVEGTNPSDGSRYSGTVAVERTGQTFRVIWEVAGSRHVGTGLGNDKFLAVSYGSGSASGLALYGSEGDGIWVGIWTYSGGRQTGTERWLPRQ